MSLNFTCPFGGSWYVCSEEAASGFLGCCASDPCSDGCSDGDLRPAGFDPDEYNDLRDQQCDHGSQYYSCTAGNTFLGCCKSDPCNGDGCNAADLTAAFLSSNPVVAAPFVGTTSSPTASSTSSFSTTSSSDVTTSTASSGSAGSATTSTPAPSRHEGSHLGLIIGSVVGGVLGLAVLGGILCAVYICLQHRRQEPCPELPEIDVLERIKSDNLEEKIFPGSPQTPRSHQHPFSPSAPPPFSPPPPSYVSHDYDATLAHSRSDSHELSADAAPGLAVPMPDMSQRHELESGQHYHAYRPDRFCRGPLRASDASESAIIE